MLNSLGSSTVTKQKSPLECQQGSGRSHECFLPMLMAAGHNLIVAPGALNVFFSIPMPCRSFQQLLLI